MSMNMQICNSINFHMKKKSKSNYVDLISVDQQNKIMCVSVNPHAVPNMNLHFLIRWHISSRKGGIMVLNHFWLRFNLNFFMCPRTTWGITCWVLFRYLWIDLQFWICPAELPSRFSSNFFCEMRLLRSLRPLGLLRLLRSLRPKIF